MYLSLKINVVGTCLINAILSSDHIFWFYDEMLEIIPKLSWLQPICSFEDQMAIVTMW